MHNEINRLKFAKECLQMLPFIRKSDKNMKLLVSMAVAHKKGDQCR